MTKSLKYIFSLLLVFLVSFSLVGCGPNNTPETPGDEPPALVFEENFYYNSSKAYSGSFDVIRISQLSTPAFFKENELETSNSVEFSHISFDIQSNSAEGEDLYVSIYTTVNGLKRGCVSQKLHISTNTTTVNFYNVKWNSGSQEFMTSIPNSNAIKTNITLSKNTKFYIFYGTAVKNYDVNGNQYAVGEYNNPIGISNFCID